MPVSGGGFEQTYNAQTAFDTESKCSQMVSPEDPDTDFSSKLLPFPAVFHNRRQAQRPRLLKKRGGLPKTAGPLFLFLTAIRFQAIVCLISLPLTMNMTISAMLVA